jgi:transcriptional regulator with XRE-family HTH domain
MERLPTFAVWIWIGRTYIGGIERAERNVSLISIERIAKALKISIPELFRNV